MLPPSHHHRHHHRQQGRSPVLAQVLGVDQEPTNEARAEAKLALTMPCKEEGHLRSPQKDTPTGAKGIGLTIISNILRY